MKTCGPCTSPCAPCSPGCQPGFPVGSSGNCAVNASLFAQGVVGSTIVGGTLTPTIVPGMQTAAFNSPTPETLLIDANAVVGFSGEPPGGFFSAAFEVFVDGVLVPGSVFATTAEEAGEFTQSTTLAFTVAAGAHIVDVRWFAPGSDGSTDTLVAGNLRVVRLACG